MGNKKRKQWNNAFEQEKSFVLSHSISTEEKYTQEFHENLFDVIKDKTNSEPTPFSTILDKAYNKYIDTRSRFSKGWVNTSINELTVCKAPSNNKEVLERINAALANEAVYIRDDGNNIPTVKINDNLEKLAYSDTNPSTTNILVPA